MTGIQIEKRIDEINYSIYNGKPHFPKNMQRKFTAEEKKELRELACRSMINSCLLYGSNFYERIKRWDCERQAYSVKSYADDYIKELGQETVDRLYEEQLEDFKKSKVIKNVYTDSEGCTYNSIQWANE